MKKKTIPNINFKVLIEVQEYPNEIETPMKQSFENRSIVFSALQNTSTPELEVGH